MAVLSLNLCVKAHTFGEVSLVEFRMLLNGMKHHGKFKSI